MVAGAVFALALVDPVPTATPASPARLEDVLALAGRYVARLEEELAVLVADEAYTQALFVGRDSSARRRRSTQQILDESSRYNLGRRRTVNSPTIALSFLHPRNQPRFSFHLVGQDEREGVASWRLRFAEKDRPTLTRTSRGEDVPARGLLWVEAGGGALVASRLEMRAPRGIGPVSIETAYVRDDRMGAWLPRAMREAYGETSPSAGDERVEAVATYSAWRRARVEVQPIVSVP